MVFMKKITQIFLIFLGFSILFSCNGGGSDEISADPDNLSKAQGGKFFGGTLKLNSVEKHATFFPAAIADVYSQHIASQIFEGLFKFNQQTLEVEPCIAETYEIDASKKKYTFKLRKDVYFHNDECFSDGIGRQVNAEDFKYVFEFLCSNHPLNKSQYLIADFIAGGNEYANGKTNSVSGVKVIDEFTFQIELVEPFSGFSDILALTQTAVFPKEALDKYGNDIEEKAIGTGAYILGEVGQKVILNKNTKYWKKDEFGNQLPFIAKIEISFIENKTEELAEFKAGNLDFVWGIPVEEIPNVMGTLDEAKEGKNREFEVQSVNSLQIQYFGFLLTHPAFSNIKVRKAFNYAINRDSIVNFILSGEGEPAYNGIVPAMKGYPINKVKGYDYNPTLAKQLLKEAGYPDGKGFPKITLHYNKAGQINEIVANTIQSQLKTVLNIDVEFAIFTAQELNVKRENGEIDFWRFGWIADFPDPSNFISSFHSKYIIEGETKSVNYGRYSNPEFDKYYDLAIKEVDEEKRMNYYAKAEQILMDDAAIMPIYYANEIRLVNPQLKNFHINELEFRDYSVVYFVEKENKTVRIYNFEDEVEE